MSRPDAQQLRELDLGFLRCFATPAVKKVAVTEIPPSQGSVCPSVRTGPAELSTPVALSTCFGASPHGVGDVVQAAWMAAKDELGRRGEDVAVDVLERAGLAVLARNWRCAEGELDIVATDRDATVVFCEVKTRSGEGFGSPFEAVTRAKRRKLRRLAVLWLVANPVRVVPAMRFDVVGVLWRPGAAPVVEHRAEAF